MNLRLIIGLILILGIAVLAGWVDRPKPFKIGKKEIKIFQGLDLQGGTHLVYKMDFAKIEAGDRNRAKNGVKDVIRKRIDALGVAEPVLQTGKIGETETLIIELPGIKNIDDAINLIGQTAQLEFWEQGEDQTWKPTALTGAHLKRADPSFDQQNSQPEVNLGFNSEGTDLFAEITKRNISKPVAIVLDKKIISAPTVQTAIENGQARITGLENINTARKLAIQLNAGALPVPIELIQQQNIGATLGQESLRQSFIAGIVGLLLVALFMIIFYRMLGLVAVFALLIYSIITLALFKLIPVTLTLAGIAGFILSIGMAVDANILIFERMKEEKRLGKTTQMSISDGFNRAWSSIRDSNVSSLITCTILAWFGTGSVRGFAITLAIGILVSMFTAINITRIFLRLVLREKRA